MSRPSSEGIAKVFLPHLKPKALYTVEPLIRDPLDLSTKGTCFNPMLQDRDDLSTRDKIVGPIVYLVWRFHCINLLHLKYYWFQEVN